MSERWETPYTLSTLVIRNSLINQPIVLYSQDTHQWHQRYLSPIRVPSLEKKLAKIKGHLLVQAAICCSSKYYSNWDDPGIIYKCHWCPIDTPPSALAESRLVLMPAAPCFPRNFPFRHKLDQMFTVSFGLYGVFGTATASYCTKVNSSRGLIKNLFIYTIIYPLKRYTNIGLDAIVLLQEHNFLITTL